jgi:hypothetical protein
VLARVRQIAVTLAEVGETEGAARPAGEGRGGAKGEDSFTMGGLRGRDAERGEYYAPQERDEDQGSDSDR